MDAAHGETRPDGDGVRVLLEDGVPVSLLMDLTLGPDSERALQDEQAAQVVRPR